MVILIPLGIFVLIGLIIFIVLYNGLVHARNYCDESWSDIDTELKRRYNLIPNLVETVKGYAQHEKEVLEQVINARNQAMGNHGTPTSQARDENLLISDMRRLFALVENYPDLKANQNFLHLQQELSNTEDRIQRARRFYNGNVRDLANRIETMFNFQKREYFEIHEAVMRQAPEVKL